MALAALAPVGGLLRVEEEFTATVPYSGPSQSSTLYLSNDIGTFNNTLVFEYQEYNYVCTFCITEHPFFFLD